MEFWECLISDKTSSFDIMCMFEQHIEQHVCCGSIPDLANFYVRYPQVCCYSTTILYNVFFLLIIRALDGNTWRKKTWYLMHPKLWFEETFKYQETMEETISILHTWGNYGGKPKSLWFHVVLFSSINGLGPNVDFHCWPRDLLFLSHGTFRKSWMVWENLIKIDDLGVPLFQETPLNVLQRRVHFDESPHSVHFSPFLWVFSTIS